MTTHAEPLDSVLDTVGRTPLVEVQAAPDAVPVYAKLESFNPGASIKDRIGKYMLEGMLEQGDVDPGGTIIEPTAGNTGIGIAVAAGQLDLDAVFVCLPPFAHDDQEIMAAERGLDLFVEKPLALSASKATRALKIQSRSALVGDTASVLQTDGACAGPSREVAASLVGRVPLLGFRAVATVVTANTAHRVHRVVERLAVPAEIPPATLAGGVAVGHVERPLRARVTVLAVDVERFTRRPSSFLHTGGRGPAGKTIPTCR